MDRRRHERVSWLDNDLRTRRRALLRSRWKDLTVVLVALAASAFGMSLTMHQSPVLLGLVLGLYLGATAVSSVVFMSVVDGSFHPRLGRLVERSVGTDLRRVPGVYGVISDVSFEHVNVDHVVLTPHGCLAVEVKSSFSRRQDFAQVPDLAGKVAQTRDGAQRVQRLLRSRGVDLPVRPVLLFTGLGAPFMPPVVQHDDVTITGFTDPATWVEGAAGASLDLDTARRAADELLAYREQRTEYERARPARRVGKPQPSSGAPLRSNG
ncbi:nuclease-related domain-containing protein [Modestobacter altitudinis]|uniref:nuclease-related domain-containing protein n=1 Tax=Modestobacter altitudinis TaxID=2213158 RepID=UPI00110CC398|nr:nuclease-related domain-containing protein [Modestobacter altitudinis]